METISLFQNLAPILAVVAGVLMGIVSISSSSWALVNGKELGVGGGVLTLTGMVLIGLSLFSTVEFEFGGAKFKAEIVGVSTQREEEAAPAPTASPLRLTEEEKQAIQVRQATTPLRDVDPARPTRKFYLLTFSVFAKSDNQSVDQGRILDAIEKVVYKLNPNWFSPSEVTVNSRENNFAYKLKVWGPTEITAEIHAKDGSQIIRKGLMNPANSIVLGSRTAG